MLLGVEMLLGVSCIRFKIQNLYTTFENFLTKSFIVLFYENCLHGLLSLSRYGYSGDKYWKGKTNEKNVLFERNNARWLNGHFTNMDYNFLTLKEKLCDPG